MWLSRNVGIYLNVPYLNVIYLNVIRHADFNDFLVRYKTRHRSFGTRFLLSRKRRYRYGELCLYRRHNRASVTAYALVLVVGRYTANTDA